MCNSPAASRTVGRTHVLSVVVVVLLLCCCCSCTKNRLPVQAYTPLTCSHLLLIFPSKFPFP